MSVKPGTLKNPEQGLNLKTRWKVKVKAPKKREEPDHELEALQARISELSEMAPVDRATHHAASYRSGWGQSLASIGAPAENAKVLRSRIEWAKMARFSLPTPGTIACGDCYWRGWAAAAAALEGDPVS